MTCCSALLVSAMLMTPAAQDAVNHEHTSMASDAAYELIQSPLVAKMTLRVNRITGQVDQLIKNARGALVWQSLGKPADPAGDSGGRITYYVFTSGLATRWTFLMNIRTGATWQLVEDADSKDFGWQRVPG